MSALFPSSPSDPAGRAAAHLWAKFQRSLDDGTEESIPWHTAKVLHVYRHLRERFEPLLAEDESFWRDLYVALLFHDAGKFVLNFQEENRKKAVGKSQDWERYLRHEFISCLLLLADYSTLCDDRPHALFAVAAHHKPLTKGLFKDGRIAVDQKELAYRPEDFQSIKEWLAERLAGLNIEWSPGGQSLQELEKANGKRLEAARRYFTQTAFGKITSRKGMLPDLIKTDPIGNRRRYARMLGLLHACDWAGSAGTLPLPALTYQEADLRAVMKKEIPAFENWREFQRASASEQGNVLAIAPTGSGKTEAALLWAANRPNGARIAYCLPTKVTSNAIFRRLEKFFPAKSQEAARVGVVHSGAKHYRTIDDTDAYDDRNYLTDKSFGREITACTIDQLLTIGFNLGHWQMKTLYTSRAAIIIDEIHLYQPYTLALILDTIKYLHEHCDARFYIMTATLPDKLRMLLVGTLAGKVSLIEDQEKKEQARNRWEFVDQNLSNDDFIARIGADITAGKKVLVVRNTVDECVATYRLLKGYVTNSDRLRCLHSRFTSIDRLEKERKVINLQEEPFLLVSTQVVEVSLDIDFDVLYTENAPIDALIQRAGRVNRKGKKSDTSVVVFRASDNSRKMYGEEIEDLLDRTAGQIRQRHGHRIREREMIEMVNTVYADYDVTQTRGFAEGRAKYADIQKQLEYILDNDQSLEEEAATREGIESVSVIPLVFKENLAGKGLAYKSQFQVNIRPDQYARLPTREKDEEHDFLVYVDADYSSETGLIIPAWDDLNQSAGTTTTQFTP